MSESRGSQYLRMDLEKACRKLGRELKAQMMPGVGFALVIFDFGPGGSMAYISTAQRADMLATLRELIAKLEATEVMS